MDDAKAGIEATPGHRVQGARGRGVHRRVQDRRHRPLRRGAALQLPPAFGLHPRVQRQQAHAVQGAHLRQERTWTSSRRPRSSSSTSTRSTSCTPARTPTRATPTPDAAAIAMTYQLDILIPTARFVFSVEGDAVEVLPEHRSPEAFARVPRAARAPAGGGHDHVPQHAAAPRAEDDRRRPGAAPAERPRAARARGARALRRRRRPGGAHARAPRPRRRVRLADGPGRRARAGDAVAVLGARRRPARAASRWSGWPATPASSPPAWSGRSPRGTATGTSACAPRRTRAGPCSAATPSVPAGRPSTRWSSPTGPEGPALLESWRRIRAWEPDARGRRPHPAVLALKPAARRSVPRPACATLRPLVTTPGRLLRAYL